MKRIKTIAISISLSLIFSCFVVGLYASNNYSHYSDIDFGISKHKVHLKLAPLDYPETFEKDYQIDSLMKSNDFKKITKPTNFNEGYIEESSKVEDSMINSDHIKTPCSNSQSDFIEKTWMRKHSFMIL